jgi:hypothetical protein
MQQGLKALTNVKAVEVVGIKMFKQLLICFTKIISKESSN